MTLREALLEAAATLEHAACPSPRVDAELLLAHALGVSRAALYASLDDELEAVAGSVYAGLVARWAGRAPRAYILGEWGFRRLTLAVDPRVLIPRPETEIVVERCLALLEGTPAPEVLDVGVGSGAIALAIVDEHPDARVTGFDDSADALAVASENASRTGLGPRVQLVEHDLRSGFGRSAFDLVVSNPPYVNPDEIEALEPEVRDWEPRGALVANGHTAAVIEASRAALKPGGWLVLEVAGANARSVARDVAERGYGAVRISLDLAGRERVVEARLEQRVA